MKTITKTPSCEPRGTWCRDARTTSTRVPTLRLRRRRLAPGKTLIAWVLGLTAVAALSTAIARAAGLGL